MNHACHAIGCLLNERNESTTFMRIGLSNAREHEFSSELLAHCITYIVSASNEYWVINWLKLCDVNLPIFLSLVQNASWPLQLMLYRKEIHSLKEPRIISKSMFNSFLLLGCLASFISLTRMLGLSKLPPTLYVICANTEIVFEALMTRVILHRQVSTLQLIGVSLVLCGVFVALYDPTTHSFGGGHGQGYSQKVILIGVAASLSSRFASSLNTILAERFLGKEAKSRIGVLECAVANSIIPFFVVPLAFTWDKEYTTWYPVLFKHPGRIIVLIVFLCFLLCFSKHFDRLSKYAIVSLTSTIFFAGVDSIMKMLAGVGSSLFFGDKISWSVFIGFVLVLASVVVLYFDKKFRSTNPNIQSSTDTSLTFVMPHHEEVKLQIVQVPPSLG